MNQKEIELKRNENEKLYHVPSMPNYAHRKRNAIFLNKHNTVKHEMAKALGAYMLSKWGDIIFSEDTLNSLEALDLAVNSDMGDFPKNESEWITECVPNDEPNRRVDLVKLDDDTRFEFEVDHKKNKGDGVITIYL